MVKSLVFCIFILMSCTGEIKTREQAKDFIEDNHGYFVKEDSIFVWSKIESFDIEDFEAGDFNDDSIIDHLISGRVRSMLGQYTHDRKETFVISKNDILPFPSSYFQERGSEFTPPVAHVVKKGENDLISVTHDSLEFLFTIENNSFLPFSENPSERTLSSIFFDPGACFGTCSVFELTIDDNLNMIFNGKAYVKKMGERHLKVTQQQWDYIVHLTKNIRVKI